MSNSAWRQSGLRRQLKDALQAPALLFDPAVRWFHGNGHGRLGGAKTLGGLRPRGTRSTAMIFSGPPASGLTSSIQPAREGCCPHGQAGSIIGPRARHGSPGYRQRTRPSSPQPDARGPSDGPRCVNGPSESPSRYCGTSATRLQRPPWRSRPERCRPPCPELTAAWAEWLPDGTTLPSRRHPEAARLVTSPLGDFTPG